MVLVSYSGKEINAKLVYYGPGLSGKTTNLEQIYGSIPQTHRGKMVSMKTKTERTLFFDFLPVNLGELAGFKTRFLLYTVPGQVYYNATRKLVLKGVDAVVFVADSKRGKMDENVESLDNLKENLRENGLSLDTLPWVIQYNKRDLPDAYSLDELQQVLNPQNVPFYEAVAMNGQGVVETFKAVSKLLLRKLSKEVGAPILSNKAAAASSSEAGEAHASAPVTSSPPPVAAPEPTVPPAPQATPYGSASSAAAAAFASASPSAPPTARPASPPAATPSPFELFGAPGAAGHATTAGRDLGLTRGADSFELGSAPEASRAESSAPPTAGGEDSQLSVGDRLRRWLGRKESTSAESDASWPQATPGDRPTQPSPFSVGSSAPESPMEVQPAAPSGAGLSRSFELDAGMSSGAEPPVAHRPEARRFEIERDPLPPSAPEPVTVAPSTPPTPRMEVPAAPAPATAPARLSAEPRTITVPVELSAEDVSAGVVLRLELKVSAGARHDGPQRGDRAA